MVYVRLSIDVNVERVEYRETNILRLRFEISGRKYGITVSYRPPSINLGYYISDLNDYLGGLIGSDVEIFLGEVNIYIRDNSCTDCLSYQTSMKHIGYFPEINYTTRETNISATIIDHIYVKMKSNLRKTLVLHPGIIQTSLTDHWSIFLSINTPKVTNPISYNSNKAI